MEFTAEEVARLVGGKVEGDPGAKATRFARIEDAKAGDLCFYANPKYEKYVYRCDGPVMLVNQDFVPREPVKATLVRVEDAYTAIARMLKVAADGKRKPRRLRSLLAWAHPTARFGKKVALHAFSYVGRSTRIGDGTVILQHVTIGEGCTIGKDCLLYPGVRVYPGTVIGDRVILHAGCVIGSDGFGNAPQEDGTWKKIEHLGNVVIGDDVEIGANTTVDRAEMESTVIGRGVRIDNLCQIAHNVVIGEDTVIAAQTGIAGSTKVGKRCKIGGQVGIVGHLTIADDTVIGAQSGVIGSIRKEGQTVFGTPSIDLKQYMKAYVHFKESGRE